MGFGHKQLSKPTPAKLVWIVRVYTSVVVAFIAWMPTTTFIGHQFQDISTSILGFTVTLGNVMLPFFGVETEQKNVPISEVSSMEAPESKDSKKE